MLCGRSSKESRAALLALAFFLRGGGGLVSLQPRTASIVRQTSTIAGSGDPVVRRRRLTSSLHRIGLDWRKSTCGALNAPFFVGSRTLTHTYPWSCPTPDSVCPAIVNPTITTTRERSAEAEAIRGSTSPTREYYYVLQITVEVERAPFTSAKSCKHWTGLTPFFSSLAPRMVQHQHAGTSDPFWLASVRDEAEEQPSIYLQFAAKDSDAGRCDPLWWETSAEVASRRTLERQRPDSIRDADR